MSGPQSFDEMHRGLKRRKEKLHQRNIQIKDLSHRIKKAESDSSKWQARCRELEAMVERMAELMREYHDRALPCVGDCRTEEILEAYAAMKGNKDVQ